MKENYKRIIKGILLICLTFFMGFNVIDVSAEEKKCQTDNFKGSIKNNPNSKIITISANGDENQWNAYLIVPEELHDVQKDFTYTGISYTLSNDTIQISYNGYTSDNIGILLVKTNNECADAKTIIQKIESARTNTVTIDDDDDENKNKSYYIEGFGYQIIKLVGKEQISNDKKDSLCDQLQAGNFTCVEGTGISQSVFNASWQGVTTQQKYKSYIPACYKSLLSSKPTNQEIKNQIANAITAYYFDNIGSIGTNMPINFRNMPVGSTNTIIFILYKENNIKIPSNIAGLMLSGILSDTLILTSPTTTELDKEAVEKLAKLAGVDYQEYGLNMLKAGSSLKGKTKEEVLYTDYKNYPVGDQKIGLGQLSTTNPDEILEEKEEYIELLNNVSEGNDYYFVALFITDIIHKGSYVLYSKRAEDILRKVYKNEKLTQGTFLEGVVSRKKQILPGIMLEMEES